MLRYVFYNGMQALKLCRGQTAEIYYLQEVKCMSTTVVGILGFLCIAVIVVVLFQSKTLPSVAFIAFPAILAVILVIGGYYTFENIGDLIKAGFSSTGPTRRLLPRPPGRRPPPLPKRRRPARSPFQRPVRRPRRLRSHRPRRLPLWSTSPRLRRRPAPTCPRPMTGAGPGSGWRCVS